MKIAVLSIVLAIAGATSAKAASVFSDDFESDAYALNASLNNWTVASGSIDTIGGGFYGFYGAGKYLDMNGSTGQGGRIESGPISLQVGRKYLLSFDYGNNKNSNNDEVLSFGISGFSGSLAISGYIANLLHHTVEFTADGSGQTLFFADTGNTPYDYGGPILDNVTVSAVPVPAAAPLLLGALGALAAIRRRRRA